MKTKESLQVINNISYFAIQQPDVAVTVVDFLLKVQDKFLLSKFRHLILQSNSK
jgi:hypothetical protein